MEYRMSNKKYHFDSQSHNSSSQFKEVLRALVTAPNDSAFVTAFSENPAFSHPIYN